ncbi:MAG TPA: protocatechuate 3,4-dioxygenase subunit alpha [bacterium]|nr:protocatechuate 3,4-dioxygenase subunit alpha [bacterium]
MSVLPLTPPQTVGPFFAPLIREGQNILVSAATVGERIRIEGQVLDGRRDPVSDAMLEIWQANAAGRYRHPADRRDVPLDPAFLGFGRAGTDEEGRYWFETIRPGPVPFDPAGQQSPHINVAVFARGLLHHLCTRIYFPEDGPLAADPILRYVPQHRRATLVALPAAPAGAMKVYRFDIVLQGEGETVFFDV